MKAQLGFFFFFFFLTCSRWQTETDGGSRGRTNVVPIADGEMPRLWNCFGDLCPGNSEIEKKEEKKNRTPTKQSVWPPTRSELNPDWLVTIGTPTGVQWFKGGEIVYIVQ